jgi:hypothetical protein
MIMRLGGTGGKLFIAVVRDHHLPTGDQCKDAFENIAHQALDTPTSPAYTANVSVTRKKAIKA